MPNISAVVINFSAVSHGSFFHGRKFGLVVWYAMAGTGYVAPIRQRHFPYAFFYFFPNIIGSLKGIRQYELTVNAAVKTYSAAEFRLESF
jgi:hypothetical protein